MKIVRTPPFLLLVLLSLAGEAGCGAPADLDTTDTDLSDLDTSADAIVSRWIADDADDAGARVRPLDQKQPTRDPGVRDGADGVLADTLIPCIREGGFMKRCPKGESCVYDRAEDGTKGAAYCVDKNREPTGNVPTLRAVRVRR
jgi:hypothetical protein